MKNKNILFEEALVKRGVSVADAVRLILNILDSYRVDSRESAIEFCAKVIEVGKKHIRAIEMKFSLGLAIYLERKKCLRPDSFRDIKYLSNRLMKTNPEFANRNFSEFTVSECEDWLTQTFSTPSQYNKGRAMLHALFEFAVRRQWCEKNVVHLVERKKVIEKEIKPLSLTQVRELLKISQTQKFDDCATAVAVLTLAGIRPKEVRRLKWSDIDLDENTITIRSQCSKTGGVRQVEIYPALRNILNSRKSDSCSNICLPNWQHRWKLVRNNSGFKGNWTQDVLRHTYASYHAKYFHDLSRLQLNMGHRDQTLLRSRYVNMENISRRDAEKFFSK